MKSKYRTFLSDIAFFSISVFIPKAISFLLLPLYTNCLSTVEYGIADLVTTTVSLLVPILTLDINDAVLRFTIEDKKDTRPLKIALSNVIIGTIIVALAVVTNDMTHLIKMDRVISFFMVLNYASVSVYGICVAYLRAVEKVGLLSFSSILITLITVASNILFLVVMHAGLAGYILSGFIGYAIADMFILCKIQIVRVLLDTDPVDKSLYKQMLTYSIPLIAANISWWVNSSSDRYIVTALRGINENGIYSIAYKIPTILQMLQSVFSQAWLLSAFREYKHEEGPQYIACVYEMYYVVMSLACAVLIILDIPLARFLYAKEFFSAWRYVPFLLISVVMIANCGFFESMLTLQKKSKIVARTAILGATVNVLLNIVLIHYMGTLGAAIATMCGYVVMWITRIRPVMTGYKFRVNWIKIAILYVILIAEALVMTLSQNYTLCILLVLLMLLINRTTVGTIFRQMLSMLHVKRHKSC